MRRHLRGEWLPHVHEKPPRNALAMSALMFAYHQPRLMRLIEDAMEAAGFEYLDPPPPPSATGERSDLV
jgi:hypothetical protein